MDIFLTRLFSGMTSGSVYAMIAITLVVVYRSSKTINFAQGEFALFTTYLAWWLSTAAGVAAWLTVPLVIVCGFVMGASAERFLIRPVSRRSEMGVLIVCLALFTSLNGLDGLLWGSDNKTVESLLPSGPDDYLEIAGARLQYDTIGMLILLALIVAVVLAILNRTSFGLQMRAVASQPESSSLSGVRVGRVLMGSWGLAAAIGSVAGLVLTPVLPPNALSLNTMFVVLIYGSAAALLGGLDSIKGAVVGGLVLGIAQAMIAGYLGATGGELKLTLAMLTIVAVLVIRPSGLFGSKEVERV
jgi:branched-chain amino acid transport system permease protein